MKTYLVVSVALVSLLCGVTVPASAQTLFVPSGTGGIGTSSQAGRVGIGTSSPDTQTNLHVKGSVLVETGANTSGTVRNKGYYSWNDEAYGLELHYDAGSARWGTAIFARTDSDIRLGHYAGNATAQNAFSPKMVVTNSGTVGIGTVSPTAKLDVRGFLTLQAGDSPQLYTGTEAAELNRYLLLINSPNYGSASGLKAGGVLVSDSYSYANPDKNDLVVKGNVGIGTASPAAALHVSRNGGGADSGQLVRITDSAIANGIGPLSLTIGSDNHWAYNPGIVMTGTNSISLGVGDGSVLSSQRALTVVASGNVGIGTTNPTQKLSVNGSIRAKEVIVEASPWADDVFAPGYVLPTVDEVAAHIATAGHLPGVPSAATVAEQGVALGEMQTTLLRKVEELTLYVIAQDKRIKSLEQQLAAASSSGGAASVSP